MTIDPQPTTPAPLGRISCREAVREAIRSMTGEAEGIAVYGEQPPALLLDSIAALRQLAAIITEAVDLQRIRDDAGGGLTSLPRIRSADLIARLAAGFPVPSPGVPAPAGEQR